MTLDARNYYSDEEIKRRILKYLTKYKNIIDTEYKGHKNNIIWYYKKGIKVFIYITEQGAEIFFLNYDNGIVIDIHRHEKVPKFTKYMMKQRLSPWSFKALLDNPEHYARKEANTLVSWITSQKEQEEYEIKLNYQHIHDSTVGWIISYFEQSKDTYNTTLKNHDKELYTLSRILKSLINLTITHIMANNFSIFEVHEQVCKDFESSIFLALNGKYIPATALLRRWLETLLCAAYIDKKLECDKNSRTYEYWEVKRDAWLIGKRGLPNFSGNYGIIDELLDPDTNYFTSQIMDIDDFKKTLKRLYSELSKYVHFGGNREDQLLLDFSSYNQANFEYWMSNVKKVFRYTNIVVLMTFENVYDIFDKETSTMDEVEYEKLLSEKQIEKYLEIKKIFERVDKKPSK